MPIAHNRDASAPDTKQPGQFDQQHERCQPEQSQHRLQDAGQDQRRPQRRQQATGGLGTPTAPRRFLGCRRGFRLIIGRRRLDHVGFGLVAAASAHRAPGVPVGLGVHLGFGETELVTQPRPDVLERRGLGRCPRVPVRPIPGLDRRGQGFLVVAGRPVHPQAGMLREWDQCVVVVVLLEIHLDRDIVGNRSDNAVDSGDRG
jgi:hypothetical protein